MAATPAPLPPTLVGGVPLSDPDRHRAYIAGLQRDLNRHLRRLGSPRALAVDGEWDEHTDLAFKQVCRVLGLAPERNVRIFRLVAGSAAARTGAERELARSDGAAFERELRREFAGKAPGTLSPDERRRAYVAALQRDLNRLDPEAPLAIDGEWDPETDRAFKRVCTRLGIPPERTVRAFRLIAGAAAEQPAAAAAKRVVLGGPSLARERRGRAYVAALQRDLNRHLAMLGSPAIVAVDGEWGEHTRRAFERVCRVLGVEPERSVRTFRVIAGTLAERTAAERAKAAEDGKAYEQRLRRHFAEQEIALAKDPKPKPGPVARPKPKPGPVARPKPKPKPKPKPRRRTKPRPTPAGGRVEAIIRAHGGRYADHIVAEARRSGLSVALVCAVVEQESGFANVFGHDRVRNPVKGPPNGNLAVTEALYRKYLGFRRQGQGAQGVGPMQLTSPGLQDRADALGGCWQPGPNIRVGCEYLAGNIKRTGSVRGGLVAYNGSSAYADPVLALERKWRLRLGRDAAVPAKAGPRTLRLTKPRMTGDDVKAFQRMLNRRFEAWHVPRRLGEDGELGPETRKAARQIAYGLGLAEAEYEHGFSPAVRTLMREPSRRTPAQAERARRRAGWRKQLRARSTARAASLATLLGGHRAPRPAGLRRIILRAHEGGLVVTSTNDGSHAATSYHYRDRAVDFGLPGPLVNTSEGRDRLVRFQRALARQPGGLSELFGPDNAANVKNGRRISLAEGTALENQHDNHVHVAI